MILAGIDEAGYGPVLGPLVVGCCAFEVPASEGEAPDCWKMLRKIASKTRPAKPGRRLHINDSKMVYSPSFGLKELERSILAIANCLHGPKTELDHLLSATSANCVGEINSHAWYLKPADETFPIELDQASMQIATNALRAELARAGVSVAHLAARVMCERPLNVMFERTRNKSNVLFSLASIHLDHLVRNFGERGLLIYCDRQGGRAHYGQLLRQQFEGWDHEVVSETDGRSEYAMHRREHVVKIIFSEKCETLCMPTALASMISKYLREALMHRFNAFWRQYLPNLEPTAGYYNDGLRFLKDIADTRKQLGVTDEMLVRSR